MRPTIKITRLIVSFIHADALREVQHKLSQNRSAGDMAGVRGGLGAAAAVDKLKSLSN